MLLKNRIKSSSLADVSLAGVETYPDVNANGHATLSKRSVPGCWKAGREKVCAQVVICLREGSLLSNSFSERLSHSEW